jgi:hypothetical protein
VVSTQAAWHEEQEVVEVTYRPDRIGFGALLASAEASDCATSVYTTTDAQLKAARARVGARARPLEGQVRRSKESDQLYYLRKSALRHLDLTPLQSLRVNAALGRKERPGKWLSPRQVARAKELEED